MNQTELLPAMATPAVSSPRPKGLLRRLWKQLLEVSAVAVWHHYDSPWQRDKD